MTITLCNTADPPKKLDKTLTGSANYTGAFRSGDNPSDSDPVIVVNIPYATAVSYNYAQFFGKSYFIRDRKAVSANTTEITFHKDVLSTFKVGIRTNSALIDRQQSGSVGDVDLDDSAFVVKRSYLDTYTLSGYSTPSATIVLGVTGTI